MGNKPMFFYITTENDQFIWVNRSQIKWIEVLSDQRLVITFIDGTMKVTKETFDQLSGRINLTSPL